MTSLGCQRETVRTSLLYRGLAAVPPQPLLTWLTTLDVNCSLVALTPTVGPFQCDMEPAPSGYTTDQWCLARTLLNC